MGRVYVGLIRAYRTRIGRIKAGTGGAKGGCEGKGGGEGSGDGGSGE